MPSKATMTGSTWRKSTDSREMIELVRRKASNRKLRLFACGLCRRLLGQSWTEIQRAAVEVSERYADDLVTKAEIQKADRAILREHYEILNRLDEERTKKEKDRSADFDLWESQTDVLEVFRLVLHG